MKALRDPVSESTFCLLPRTTSTAVRRLVQRSHVSWRRGYGFKCTVLFGQTEEGVIKPGSSKIPGIETIADADMLFLFLRFINPEDEWLKQFEGYLKRGGPVLGLRTTTHAFNGIQGDYAFFNFNHSDPKFVGGFGRQILGETWNPKLGAGHYGRNHQFATAMHSVPENSEHPVLRGVGEMHAMAGAYSARPMPGSTILATNQVLQSMEAGAPPVADKEPQPAAWVREYQYEGGPKGEYSAAHKVLRRIFSAMV